MHSRSEELEAMKRIDLRQYVASRGFQYDRKKSSRGSAVMRHTNGDKLIIGRAPSGQYIYFNAKGSDRGTIIDFIQTRDRVSLGEVRKLLRPWIGSDAPSSPLPVFQKPLEVTEHNAAGVLAAWMKTKPLQETHPYLERERAIPQDILMHPIFRDRIRRDARGNAVFPHFNASGLCGFELKNRNWTGFSPGGVKGLAGSLPRDSDRQLIVCETAIDMLSYAALFGIEERRFVSTAGQISPAQAEALKATIEAMTAITEVILAFDHDDGGHKLALQVREVLTPAGIPIREHAPTQLGDDWNDVLRRSDAPELRRLALSFPG